MDITIEPLKLAELVAYLRIQANDAFPSLKDEARLKMLAEKWHTYAEFCTCRDKDGHLVGMIAFYANHPESGEAYIPHIYVSPEYRKQGLFNRMLEHVIHSVRIKGFREIRLEVDRQNKDAQKCYLNNGFLITTSVEPLLSSFHMTKRID